MPRAASVKASTAAVVASMPASTFRKALAQHADVRDQLLLRLVARARALTARVGELSTLSVRDRLRAELLRLGRRRADQPNRAIISPTPIHDEFAGRISTHREAVSREFATLERGGLLERRRGALVICDVAALAHSLEGAGAQYISCDDRTEGWGRVAGSRAEDAR
jgi:CRP/FNR family transcriptional regulator, cyclic AMP receptor protein